MSKPRIEIKNIDKTRNYLFKEIKQNDLMSKRYKNVDTMLNYIEHLFALVSTITGCVSKSFFASLVGTPIGNVNSAIGLTM